ncbi:hypothetical protein [Kineosporia sp. NBRC 101677]|nr:hypothetical protein [Kineosporia sp. NBRC 101677]
MLVALGLTGELEDDGLVDAVGPGDAGVEFGSEGAGLAAGGPAVSAV